MDKKNQGRAVGNMSPEKSLKGDKAVLESFYGQTDEKKSKAKSKAKDDQPQGK